jgi:hypothetical protein
MEEGIKKKKGKNEIFGEIGEIENMKKVDRCKNEVD